MSDHPVTLAVPEHIYDRARQIAKATSQPLEQVLIKRLEESFTELSELQPDEQAELSAFKLLSDDTLRAISREQMSHARQEQMQRLMDRNSLGAITDHERQVLTELVKQGDRLTLRKAWAANVLMDRGYKITAQDMMAEDE